MARFVNEYIPVILLWYDPFRSSYGRELFPEVQPKWIHFWFFLLFFPSTFYPQRMNYCQRSSLQTFSGDLRTRDNYKSHAANLDTQKGCKNKSINFHCSNWAGSSVSCNNNKRNNRKEMVAGNKKGYKIIIPWSLIIVMEEKKHKVFLLLLVLQQIRIPHSVMDWKIYYLLITWPLSFLLPHLFLACCK